MINENVLRNLGVIIHIAIFMEKKGWNNDYKAVRHLQFKKCNIQKNAISHGSKVFNSVIFDSPKSYNPKREKKLS